ncbi:MAG TPA: hypothetical protein DIW47_04005 [Bacteroidetes bacterium]|nr:hypothetical protein [Bacteroidota bacterium]
MKRKLPALLCGLLLFAAADAQIAKQRVVLIDVETDAQGPSITLRWNNVAGVTGHSVVRKEVNNWGWQPLKILGAQDTVFTDTTVEIGKIYEYYVQRQISTTYLYGFVATGIEIPEIHYRGEVFIALDSALNAAIPEKLTEFYTTLVGDGWRVHPVVISSSWGVVQVKDTIKKWHLINPHRHNTLLLFGDIPVPYSGNLNPDAHPDHLGAWPSDVYYGEFAANWTDANNYPGATRPENVNLPGDGKFDQTSIPGELKLQIGRVYLDNLTLFGLTRDSLYTRYLTKDIAYRMNEWNVPRRALIDDALGALGGEYPGRNGFQNGNALFGAENTITAYDTFIKILRTEPYLFSHASSTGGYTSNKQLNSSMFKTATYSVFQTSFGSYHGDWDINNNLLRAEIAGPGYGLTAVWAGRPQWHFLHMTMGAPIGFSANVTQNNFIDGNHQTYDPGYGAGWVHVALMGDPTLRLHAMSPAKNATATTISNNDQVSLAWDASDDTTVIGYHIYRSDTLFGIWNPVTQVPVNSLTYTDIHPLKGNNWYMVRAVKLESSQGGTYYNMSQGVFSSAHAANGDGTLLGTDLANARIRVYPNPGTGIFHLELPATVSGNVLVFDMTGKAVFEATAQSNMIVNLTQLRSGIYLIRVGEYSEKIVVQP